MKTTYLGLEVKRALRNPRFLMFTMVFPVVIFLIDVGAFGKGNVPGSTASYASYLMVSMAAWGAFMAAMNTGARTAVERAAGWQRQLRLTPLRPTSYLLAKGTVGTVVALPPILLVALVGVFAEGVRLSGAGWVQVILGVWVATIPFAVLGLLVGQLATSETMQVFTTGLMIVLGFLGGVLIPVTVFPAWMASIAKVLPSYWLADIGHGALVGNTDTGRAVIWLVGWTVVLAFAVVRRYQRDSARV
ncbi:MAG TPA: ABC transporter permease [Pseudonocardiaceae bacterium]|nr:ABC transporter permease [Pseudonocardiaceae bacterium]